MFRDLQERHRSLLQFRSRSQTLKRPQQEQHRNRNLKQQRQQELCHIHNRKPLEQPIRNRNQLLEPR